MSSADFANPDTSVPSRKRRARAEITKPSVAASVERPFSLRGFISILLVFCLFMMLISGFLLYIAPRGRVANWTSWTALALRRDQWVAVHINSSLIFIVAALFHLIKNWSRMVGYLKQRSSMRVNMKRELAAAFVLTSLILAATIFELPPISIPIELKYKLRDSWEQTSDQPTSSKVITINNSLPGDRVLSSLS
ncbi:DUF4405 domain-containing protein [Novipirellula artificiosorum]|uniref:Flavinylation-associated cytochrome domain-containing protein n=1 Tax=Novipirellula artificiosorum TaxID=2528016 RepID=A0A5C6E224_9BACT|nr:DUF4405 domain-containing protein [Novipirellula artificiosorum]TWU42765.1 hypothetical protein Poly41_10650 [Novipirellula artificiosorum]